jgi:hypothetical protein
MMASKYCRPETKTGGTIGNSALVLAASTAARMAAARASARKTVALLGVPFTLPPVLKPFAIIYPYELKKPRKI